MNVSFIIFGLNMNEAYLGKISIKYDKQPNGIEKA